MRSIFKSRSLQFACGVTVCPTLCVCVCVCVDSVRNICNTRVVCTLSSPFPIHSCTYLLEACERHRVLTSSFSFQSAWESEVRT